MKKIILCAIVSVNLFTFCMEDDSKQNEDISKEQQIINKHKQQLLKIVKPGIESIIAGGEIKPKILLENFTQAANVSQDGKYAICAANNGLCFWDLDQDKSQQGAPPATKLAEQAGAIQNIAVSACNTYVVTANYERFVKIWDLKKKKCLKTIDFNEGSLIKNIAIDRNLRFLIVKIIKNNIPSICVLKWDFNEANSNEEALLPTREAYWVDLYTQFGLSPCGKFLILGSKNGDVILLDTREYPNIKHKTFDKFHSEAIQNISINNSGTLVITQSKDKISTWSLPNLDDKSFNSKPLTDSQQNFAVSAAKYLFNLVSKKFQPNSNYLLENGLARTLTYMSDHSGIIQRISINNTTGFIEYFDYSKGTIIFDFSDLNEILTYFLIKERFWISADNRYLIVCDDCFSSGNNGGFGILRLDNWIFNELRLEQLEVIAKLIETVEPKEVLELWERTKVQFQKNLQKYIERYLRKKLLLFYFEQFTKQSANQIESIIRDY